MRAFFEITHCTNAYPHAMKKQEFFDRFESAINKIADGDQLFDSTDNDALLLQEWVKESWTPLPEATQLV